MLFSGSYSCIIIHLLKSKKEQAAPYILAPQHQHLYELALDQEQQLLYRTRTEQAAATAPPAAHAYFLNVLRKKGYFCLEESLQ